MGFLQNLFGLGSDRKKLSDPSFAYLFDKPPADEWISLDLEMTGLNPKTDHILSVGAVRIARTDGVLSVDTANALSLVCRPPVMPSTDSIVIHGLRPMDVENGVGYDEMLKVLLPFIGSRPLLGFCVDMDIGFINTQTKRLLGVNLPNKSLDISNLEQAYRQRHNRNPDAPCDKKHLNTLIKEYDIPILPAHDALNDAMMVAMLFCHLQR